MSKKEIKFEVIPHYVDEILVDGRKSHRKLIKKANSVLADYSMGYQYSFDDDDDFDTECAIEMEFYDGIALSTDGCGLYMTYPKLEDVAKSPVRQEKIQNYTGVYDWAINQYDVALTYGVLKFDKSRQKVNTSMQMQAFEHEALVLMSGDIFKDVYNMSEVYDYNLAASLVCDAALRFEKKWWEMKADDKDNELDYILEMEKFEAEELERLRKIYDNDYNDK
jgi:hypothetical protein